MKDLENKMKDIIRNTYIRKFMTRAEDDHLLILFAEDCAKQCAKLSQDYWTRTRVRDAIANPPKGQKRNTTVKDPK